MYGILIFIGVAIAYMYIVVPILMRQKMSVAAGPIFEPVSANDPRIPARVAAFWRETAPALGGLGFAPSLCLINPSSTANTMGYLALFDNRATRDRAAAYVIVSQTGAQVRCVYTVEFCTEFSDRMEICTNNCEQLPAVCAAPWRVTSRIPNLRDLGMLHQLHQTMVARHGGTKSPIPAPAARVISFRDSTLRDYQSWIECGHYFRDGARNPLRFTWKGAFLNTWAQLWPISAIRRSLMMQRARRVLREAGLPTSYPTVNYDQLAVRRTREVPADVTDSAAPLQFDRAEAVQPAAPSAGLQCTACSRPIATSYYEVNGRVMCAECQQTAARSVGQGSRFGRTLRAVVAGGAGAILGAGIYFGVAAITGYELGLVAIVLGLIVGGAVRWGAHARGGWFYQLIAIALTYTAVGMSYSAMTIREMIRNPEAFRQLATTVPAPSDAAVPAGPATQPAEGTAASMPTSHRATIRKLAFAVATLVLVLWIPILIGTQAPMSLLITAIALYEAWKINKRPLRPVSGPYEVAVAAAAAPTVTPQGDARA